MELTARYAEVEVDVMLFFIVEANKQICIRKIQIQTQIQRAEAAVSVGGHFLRIEGAQSELE